MTLIDLEVDRFHSFFNEIMIEFRRSMTYRTMRDDAANGTAACTYDCDKIRTARHVRLSLLSRKLRFASLKLPKEDFSRMHPCLYGVVRFSRSFWRRKSFRDKVEEESTGNYPTNVDQLSNGDVSFDLLTSRLDLVFGAEAELRCTAEEADNYVT